MKLKGGGGGGVGGILVTLYLSDAKKRSACASYKSLLVVYLELSFRSV